MAVFLSSRSWCLSCVIFLIVIVVSVWAQDSRFDDKCHIQSERIGCFKDAVIPSRPIPELLFTDRDPTSPVYTGGFIDLKNWNLYMDDLKCRCAEETKAKGYRVFGLQWYGECWSGPNAKQTYHSNGPSDQCVTHDLAHCTPTEETCVGRDYINFVYEIITSNHNATEHIHNNETIHHVIHVNITETNHTHIHEHIHHNITTTPPPTPTSPPTIRPTNSPVYVPCHLGCIPPTVCPPGHPCNPLFVVQKRHLITRKTNFFDRILKRDSRTGQVVRYLLGTLKNKNDRFNGFGQETKADKSKEQKSTIS